jgi:hypothetical protein
LGEEEEWEGWDEGIGKEEYRREMGVDCGNVVMDRYRGMEGRKWETGQSIFQPVARTMNEHDDFEKDVLLSIEASQSQRAYLTPLPLQMNLYKSVPPTPSHSRD